MAASAGASLAAARQRNEIEGMTAHGPVVQLSPEQFKDILETSPDVYVLRHERKTMWSEKHKSWRYLTSAKGIVFYCDTDPEIIIPPLLTVVNCDDIRVPQDL